MSNIICQHYANIKYHCGHVIYRTFQGNTATNAEAKAIIAQVEAQNKLCLECTMFGGLDAQPN